MLKVPLFLSQNREKAGDFKVKVEKNTLTPNFRLEMYFSQILIFVII